MGCSGCGGTKGKLVKQPKPKATKIITLPNGEKLKVVR